jgi:hypothetical protein
VLAASTRIVPAGGRTARQYFPCLCAAALADRLGTRIEEFPGGHAGFVTHPREFAATPAKFMHLNWENKT